MGSSGHSKIEADGAVTCPAAAAGVHLASSPGLTSGQYGKEYEFYIHVDQSRQDTCVRGLSKRDSKTEAESRPESLPTEYVGNLHGLPCLSSQGERPSARCGVVHLCTSLLVSHPGRLKASLAQPMILSQPALLKGDFHEGLWVCCLLGGVCRT